FFFQAEDGIRDFHVTGVQTCALPICSTFSTQDGAFRIVVYQNISEAIDETETKAWHKLLRVLTHEIMNSIAPISSLAETLHARLEQGKGGEEDIEDLKVGIYTIKRRSE